jgi:excisionase family DNA binding protein
MRHTKQRAGADAVVRSDPKTIGCARVENSHSDELLTPAEVARMLRVGPKTVTRWEQEGKLRCIKTLGGHRRFRRSDVERAIAALPYDD